MQSVQIFSPQPLQKPPAKIKGNAACRDQKSVTEKL